jgi:two-component system NtrC family sensor kinase
VIDVADEGTGVRSEMRQRVFRAFWRGEHAGGTGLGLYISRQIAREAGGDLILDPAVATGARFVLSLPAAAAPAVAEPLEAPVGAPAATAAEAPLRRAETLAGVHVLIVDDEEAIRRPMARFLTRRGARVEEAGDGAEALTRLATESPDVILADLRMPRMSGVELYAKLEETHPTLAARVLFLSGDVSQLAAPGNVPVPRERVLVKPVELAELERRLSAFVRGDA